MNGKSQSSAAVLDAPVGRRERNAERKRDAILGGARDVFMTHGFGGASMDAIAEAAGVSKMTLYRYFDSKEALFEGLIGAMCERVLERDPEAPLDNLPPQQALSRFARQLLRTVYAPETLALHRIVLAEVTRFPELGILFYRSGPERNIEALADYLAANAGHPALDVGDPRKAAEEFFELARGYTHLRLLLGLEPPPGEAAVAAQVDRAVARFLRKG